jgi:orotate phosphoribosyltransferase
MTTLLELLRRQGLRHLPEPVRLASGEMSDYFIDGKEALARYDDLEVACTEIVGRVRSAGIEFEASGGLTLGADALAVGIAAVARCSWFFVRKEPKSRGTRRLVEGAQIGAGTRVLLVDDVVTTGGSILQAHEAVVATGADVVAAVTLVDRGDVAAERFGELGVPYFPMATYHDLGIPRVGAARAG